MLVEPAYAFRVQKIEHLSHFRCHFSLRQSFQHRFIASVYCTPFCELLKEWFRGSHCSLKRVFSFLPKNFIVAGSIFRALTYCFCHLETRISAYKLFEAVVCLLTNVPWCWFILILSTFHSSYSISKIWINFPRCYLRSVILPSINLRLKSWCFLFISSLNRHHIS